MSTIVAGDFNVRGDFGSVFGQQANFVNWDNIVATWKGAMGSFPFVVQLVHNGHIRIDGESAVGRWYLEEKLQLGGGAGMQNIGVYQDTYRKINGDWLFARREYTVLFNDGGSGTTDGTTAAVPEGFNV